MAETRDCVVVQVNWREPLRQFPPLFGLGTWMDTTNRSKILTAVIITLVACTVWLLYSNSKPVEDKPTASNYFRGAFRNKANPNMWGDENGKPVPAPPGAFPYNPDNSGQRGPMSLK